MCLRNWTEHNREYYECSIYKKNPEIANETSGVKAREALKKYLFYYERVSFLTILLYNLSPKDLWNLHSITLSLVYVYMNAALTDQCMLSYYKDQIRNQ